jgi:hypothetical protein
MVLIGLVRAFQMPLKSSDVTNSLMRMMMRMTLSLMHEIIPKQRGDGLFMMERTSLGMNQRSLTRMRGQWQELK